MTATGDVGTRPAAARPRSGTRVLAMVPLVVFVGLAALFALRLAAGDPARLPSALIGHPAPAFDLPPLAGRAGPDAARGLSDADLRQGHVTVLNVFASWCADCHEEHALLTALARDPRMVAAGARLDGLLYKDGGEDARRFLGGKGDPYRRVGDDGSGRTGIDFGVYGVPETFVIRGDGTIAYKLIGAVTETNFGTLLTEVEKAARTPNATGPRQAEQMP